MDVTAKSSGPDIIDCVLIDPANDNLIALQNAFEEIHPAELAHILESLTLAAALSGVSIPLLLKRFAIDPALSGAVILTTVTDITGFLSFFRSGQPVSALN